MGLPIGRHLRAAGTEVIVFDPSTSARDALVALGATAADSVADVAAQCDIMLVVVVDDEQVREAVSVCVDAAEPETIVAICASVRPDTCRELAALGRERGIHVVDTAMVGGERGAEAGELVLFCGGPEEVVDRLRPVLAPFSSAVVRVGDVGAGQVAKTANNILLWACIRADAEVLRLGRALGVAPSTLRKALVHGSGANRPLAEWGEHRLRWPKKDLEVALAVAAEADVEVPLVEQLPRLMDELTVDDLRELL